MILTRKRLLVDIFLTRSLPNHSHFASLRALISSPGFCFNWVRFLNSVGEVTYQTQKTAFHYFFKHREESLKQDAKQSVRYMFTILNRN